jgi:hypothetical protein
MQRIFLNKWFPFTVGSACHVKRFATGLRNVADFSVMTKWLRQQSKDFFYAVEFDALVKRWDKCIGVCGGYVEK